MGTPERSPSAAATPVARHRVRTGLLAFAATAVLSLTAGVCTASAPGAPQASDARQDVIAHVPVPVVSEEPFAVQVDVTAETSPAAQAQLQVRAGTTWRTVLSRPLREGRAVLPAEVWRPMDVRVRVVDGARTVGLSAPSTVVPAPLLDPVPDNGLSQPSVRYPVGRSPQGPGANPTVQAIPDQVWDGMRGLTWQRGCPVGRERLRLVEVNYWGFDGYRYRGQIVVRADLAPRVAAALADLYDQGYQIRQMRLPEAFGPDRHRGATDYAMMAADNTSGFNCRYVVGREGERVLSPHAYGTAVDVNPFENPYAARTGVFPDAAWVPRSIANPVVLARPTDAAVRAFTSRGATWGGTFDSFDYHHFEWSTRR